MPNQIPLKLRYNLYHQTTIQRYFNRHLSRRFPEISFDLQNCEKALRSCVFGPARFSKANSYSLTRSHPHKAEISLASSDSFDSSQIELQRLCSDNQRLGWIWPYVIIPCSPHPHNASGYTDQLSVRRIHILPRWNIK